MNEAQDKAWERFLARHGWDLLTLKQIFAVGFQYGRDDAVEDMKKMGAQADLAGVAKVLNNFADKFSDMTDRQISNFMHGRDKDDNGEFTASRMGADWDKKFAIARQAEIDKEARAKYQATVDEINRAKDHRIWPPVDLGLVVTRGDGVPLPNQAEALEAFKQQARAKPDKPK